MSTRKKFEERIRRKEAEIQELEMKVREARAYIQALQDALKLLPRETTTPGTEGDEDVLRAGSMVAAARDLLQQRGRPMHLLDILTGLGKEPSSANRASLGGSLSAYVRKGQIFTRAGPNTFALAGVSTEPAAEPPRGFGQRSAEFEADMSDDDEAEF
jgi:hypothetical protein